ncbi:MAG: metallophosphoesterase [Planctomycetia bacterium]
MSKIYFVSDLHLYSSRSQEHRYLEQIREKANQAEQFVLGGDIFDFRWTTMTSVEATVARARHWLYELVTSCPRCHFHFVMGNHDYHGLFVQAIEHLEDKLDNLSWYPHYVRIEDNIFLHGDVVDRRAGARKMVKRRENHLYRKKRGRMASQLYDWAIQGNLHKPIVRYARTKKTIARRILNYLDEIGEGSTTGVQNIYFGHTHLAISDYEYKGIRFHNCGAPIEGLHFRIIEVQ